MALVSLLPSSLSLSISRLPLYFWSFTSILVGDLNSYKIDVWLTISRFCFGGGFVVASMFRRRDLEKKDVILRLCVCSCTTRILFFVMSKCYFVLELSWGLVFTSKIVSIQSQINIVLRCKQ